MSLTHSVVFFINNTFFRVNARLNIKHETENMYGTKIYMYIHLQYTDIMHICMCPKLKNKKKLHTNIYLDCELIFC